MCHRNPLLFSRCHVLFEAPCAVDRKRSALIVWIQSGHSIPNQCAWMQPYVQNGKLLWFLLHMASHIMTCNIQHSLLRIHQ